MDTLRILLGPNLRTKYITDVPSLFNKDPTLLLLLEEGIMQHIEDARLYLHNKQVMNVEEMINRALTAQDFLDAPAYQEAVTIYNQTIKKMYSDLTTPGYTLDQIVHHPDLLNSSITNNESITNNQLPKESPEGNRVGENNPANTIIHLQVDTEVPIKMIKKSVKSKGRKVNIEKKIEELDDDQILNVSTITDTGAGTKVLKLNKKKDIFQTKHGEMESKTYEAFLRAIKLIPHGEKDYKKDIQRAKKYFDK